MKALIVCNRKSGKHKGQKLVRKVIDGIKDLYQVETYISEYPKSITEKIIDIGSTFDVIITMGGDGTINEAISGVMKLDKKPKMAFIPMGTCNDVCHTYKYKNIKTVIKRIRENKETKIDCYSVNGGYFLYAFAVGSVSSVSYETGRSKKFLGKMFYYLRGGAKIFKKSDIGYTMNGIDNNAYVFLAINSRYLGGFKVKSPEINTGNINFYIVDYKKFTNGAFDFALLMTTGKKSKLTHLVVEKEVNLKLNKKMPFNTDGEYLGSFDYINIKVEEKAITIF